MGLELCSKCGWMHYGTDPCRAPKKSTAARKDVQVSLDAPPMRKRGVEDETASGYQSPPVDTLIVGKRRGRPQTITDMKTYRAEKARERRAKTKKPNG